LSTGRVIALRRRSEHVYRVVHAELGHVGNLQLAAGLWKFKAIGYESGGSLVPGGGPFTERHNAALQEPDAAALEQALGIEA